MSLQGMDMMTHTMGSTSPLALNSVWAPVCMCECVSDINSLLYPKLSSIWVRSREREWWEGWIVHLHLTWHTHTRTHLTMSNCGTHSWDSYGYLLEVPCYISHLQSGTAGCSEVRVLTTSSVSDLTLETTSPVYSQSVPFFEKQK